MFLTLLTVGSLCFWAGLLADFGALVVLGFGLKLGAVIAVAPALLSAEWAYWKRRAELPAHRP